MSELMCRYSGVKGIEHKYAYHPSYHNSLYIAAWKIQKALNTIKYLKLHGKKSEINDLYYFSSLPSIFNEVWNIGSMRPKRKGRRKNYALVSKEEKEASDKSSPYSKAAKTS